MKKPILVALLTGLLLVSLAHYNFFYTWNLRLTDALYGGKPALENIKIIAIDDKSLQEIGRWPWQRNVYTGIINSTKGARVTAFDIAFFEPTEQDEHLAQAMREAGNVIIAREYDFAGNTELKPAPAFQDIPTGIINVYTDQDGTSRSIPAQLNGQPSLAVKIVENYLGRTPTAPEKILVNFAGKPGSYKTYSAADVIHSRIPSTEFDNAIVLIGATAPDFHDDYFVPTSSGTRMTGVEIHAHAAQTTLTQQYLHRQSFNSLAIAILILSLLAGILYSTIKVWPTAGVLFILAIGYVLTAIALFDRGIILNLIYPAITIIIVSLTTVAYIAASEARHKKHILGIFGRYVSKDVVKHILHSAKAIELGGEEREITAFFADIRGFTSLSEKMTPNEVIKLLNHYFGDMTDQIFKHNGTLDKFIGDALFAVWGSPLKDEKHAYNAVNCALEIQEKLKGKHRPEGIPPINLGIGICTGPAVIGNMGSSQRQEFTAIGDTINTASRLSGKAEGGQIIITETTYQQIKEKFKFKKLAPLTVKGKEKPLTVYHVLGRKK